MKTLFGRPFSSSMTRRVLSIAATAAALLVTNNALADETPAAPAATETVEQPETSAAPTATETTETPAAPAVESTPVEPAPVEAAPVEPAPVEPAPALPPAPVVETAPAPVVAPAFEAPRFAPLAMIQQDRPLEAQTSGSKQDESFRVGGMVGVGFPRPFAVEGFVKVKKIVGVGFEYSFLPDTSVAGTDISFKGMAVDARVFPFKGGLFVGVRGGKQWLSTRSTVQAGPGRYTEAMSAETAFINPRVGYLKTWENGITIGIDVGVQIPINPSYSRDSDLAKNGIKSEADKTYASVANTLGNKTTPTIDLLRVGFLF